VFSGGPPARRRPEKITTGIRESPDAPDARFFEAEPAMARSTPTVAGGRSHEAEEDQLIRWRFSQLRRSGYPEDLAAEIAARRDIDLHEATSLVEAGCLPATASRILL
jgi:hypothetical protein